MYIVCCVCAYMFWSIFWFLFQFEIFLILWDTRHDVNFVRGVWKLHGLCKLCGIPEKILCLLKEFVSCVCKTTALLCELRKIDYMKTLLDLRNWKSNIIVLYFIIGKKQYVILYLVCIHLFIYVWYSVLVRSAHFGSVWHLGSLYFLHLSCAS